MKLTDHFNTFMADVVNLNQSRIDTLRARVSTISSSLATFDAFGDILIETVPQGSWAHKTIIKPSANSAMFDADIVAFVRPHKKWSAADYIEILYASFTDHGIYSGKVSRKTRCVTIQYAGEFSIDIVPCVRRNGFWETTESVVNRNTNAEERTNPSGYSDWFKRKDGYVGNNQLIKVVRLLKYLRDIKATFSAKSILLTTLIGERVSFLDADLGLGNEFTDLPTTLRIIVKRLDDYLQQNPDMPEVANPCLPSESFTRHWNHEKYSNFRACIKRYAEWIEDAYVEEDRDESIIKWRRVFGDEFANSVVIKTSAPVHAAADEDLCHVESPPWPITPVGGIKIEATLHSSERGEYRGSYRSDGKLLKPGTWVHFTAKHSFGDGVTTRWQIVNTGPSARVAGELRGAIAESGAEIWVGTRYPGRHWVEGFAIDSRRDICLGRSGRFYVNIA